MSLLITFLNVAATILALVFEIFFTIQSSQKYRKNKSKTRKYLTFHFFTGILYTVANLMDSIFYQILKAYTIRIGFMITMFTNAFFYISLLYFSFEIFYSEKEKSRRNMFLKAAFSTVQIVLGIAGAIFIYIGQWEGWDLSVTITSTIVMMTAFLFTIILGFNSYKLAKKVEDKKFKTSLKNMGNYTVAWVIIYILQIMGSIPPLEYGDFSIWSYMSWNFFILASYYAYIGFINPYSKLKFKRWFGK